MYLGIKKEPEQARRNDATVLPMFRTAESLDLNGHLQKL